MLPFSRSTCICLIASVVMGPLYSLHAAPFRRGDADTNGTINLSDALSTLRFLFVVGGTPDCRDAMDANDDGALNITDAVYTLTYLFIGGVAPPGPYEVCGEDPTADALTCSQFSSCVEPGSVLVGRVLLTVVIPLSSAELEAIDEPLRQRLREQGLEIQEGEGALRSKPEPLMGRWVEILGKRHMLDRQGYLFLRELGPTLQGVQSAAVYWELTDKKPFLTLPDLRLFPEGQEPVPAEVEVAFKIPQDMDDLGASADGPACKDCTLDEESGCLRRNECAEPGSTEENKEACCLDYDGPFGDAIPWDRESCPGRGIRNFLRSTCAFWVHPGRACLNELVGIDGGPPNCWHNHKYRNCQTLDADYFGFFLDSVPPDPLSLHLKAGDSYVIKLNNNLPANSTRLTVEGPTGAPGLELALESSGPALVNTGGNTWRLDHFSDSETTHYKDVRIQVRAPTALSPGSCDEKYALIAEAGGFTKRLPIRVTPATNRWRGTARYEVEGILPGIVVVSGLRIRARWVAEVLIGFNAPPETCCDGKLTYSAELLNAQGCSFASIGPTEVTVLPGHGALKLNEDTEGTTYLGAGFSPFEMLFEGTCQDARGQAQRAWQSVSWNGVWLYVPTAQPLEGCRFTGSIDDLDPETETQDRLEWSFERVP